MFKAKHDFTEIKKKKRYNLELEQQDLKYSPLSC